MADPSPSDGRERHGKRRHEQTDVRPTYVGLFAVALAIMTALVLLVLNWTMHRFERKARRADPRASPVARDQTPPEPRLQSNPGADLVGLRREEDRRLSSYAWVDRKEGQVQVPIDRAIEILAERGLPEPKGPVELPKDQPPKGREPAP